MTIFFDEYRNTGFGDTPVSYGGEEIGLFEAMGLAYESQVRGSNIDTFVELSRITSCYRYNIRTTGY